MKQISTRAVLVFLLCTLSCSGFAAVTVEPQFVYPRTVESEAGTVVIHPPQILDWEDFAEAEGLVAVEFTPADGTETRFVSIDFRAQAVLAAGSDIVEVDDVELVSMSLGDGSSLPAAQAAAIRAAVPAGARQLPLDLMVSYLADGAVPEGAAGIVSEPPEIIVTQRNARLVLLVGEPVLAPVAPGSSSEFVANTNWPLFREGGRWYLLDNKSWLVSETLTDGWQWVDRLPDGLLSLPETDDWKSTRAAARGWKATETGRPPEIYVREKPAELIALDGPPRVSPIADTGIDYVTNTEGFLFRYERIWYFLVSGRWFQTEQLDAGWQAVSDLPEAFAAIPEDHPAGAVLAAVPGTEEAQMASLKALAPSKTKLPRDVQVPDEVTYAGEPAFEPIDGVPELSRATNTAFDVVLVGDVYYLCYSGAWYHSSAATGPWVLAEEVPEAIYRIPPSSPLYHTTYVKVYETTPTTIVYGHSSGYNNVYIVNGVPVYGTGYYYPPYYYPYGAFPIYYPYPYSYGSSSYYNPRTGTYGSVTRAYGPYGGWGYASAYNPRTGTYGRAEAVWDHDEWYAVGEAYNPSTGRYAETERYWNDKNDSWEIETSVDGPRGGIDIRRTFDDDSGTFKYETDRGGEGTIKRNRTDDGWETESNIELADGRTIEGSGSFDERGEGTANLRGSEGGTGSIERSVDDGQATREATFSKDGRTIESTTTRDFDGSGATRTIEGSEGGRLVTTGRSGDKSFIGQSQSGDVYAGRDGNVYKRTDEGWQRHDGSGWSSVESRRTGSTTATQRQRTTASGQRSGGGDYRSQLDRHYQARQRASRSFSRSGGIGAAGRGGLRRRR